MSTFIQGYLEGYQKVAYPGTGQPQVPISKMGEFAKDDLLHLLRKIRPSKIGDYAVGRGRTRAGAAQASRMGGRVPKMSAGVSVGKELTPGPETNLRGSL